MSVAASIACCLLVLGIPGLVTGAAAGLRGWQLAGLTPLLSYAIGGLAGPWTAAIGLPFNAWTFALATVLFAVVAFGLRWFTVRRWPHEPEVRAWEPRANWAVGACVILATAIGFYTAVRGMGHLGAIAQGGDAPYAANGVRYIAETGDGSLFGMGTVNWYGDGAPPFYPNAYHLLASVQYTLSGGSIPLTLDVNTALLPGLLALSLVVLVRAFRGRAVLAGAVALASAAPVMGMYESMDRGPLYPFLLGMALTPLAAVVLRRYLDRVAPDTGFVLLVSAVGLLCIHSSTLFGAILFAGPLLVQRWIERWRSIGKDLLALLPIAVLAMLVAWLQLFGALGLANSSTVQYLGWPSEWRATTALGALLGFQHFQPQPQIFLSVALLAGFIFFRRLGALRWIGLTALITGVFYMAVSSSDAPLVMALARPWWDDPYRFITMATVPLSFIAGHGIAALHEWLKERLPARVPPAALAAVVLIAFVGATKGLYTRTNSEVVAKGYHRPDPRTQEITPGEERAMTELGKLAKPGQWAMNDRWDGTPWTYALSGVRTVAAHDDGTKPPSDAVLLAAKFRDYETDPAVRAAVQRLNIRWVILGRPAAPPKRAYADPGLNGLAGLPFLKEVYRNEDSVIYQLNR
ncbi:hypothetical protein G3I59_42470 [Amycolatopsis rubida]|uniref:Copper-transporting ATPase n=1 Tax=Amycolatopsis rubida TaxID=112413 RepID=A0ABX0C4Q8_9PSEU|nr:DUF6541 family protein [Amycolatopsis rubida]MYW97108.1 hypothetical protein [Amycolatopsis rubida]NEC62093.1 hypothetical protein [Amycolatopsis rubida]